MISVIVMLFSCTDKTEYEPLKHYEIHVMMKKASCAVTLNGITTFYNTETASVKVFKTQILENLYIQNLSDGEVIVVIKDYFNNTQQNTGNITNFLRIK